LAWHFIGIPAWSTAGDLSYILCKVFLLGGAGVDLFFVLSGFLITRIAITRRQANGRFLLAFYIRRSLRILPPYLLLTAVFWIGVLSFSRNVVFNQDIPLWRFLTFTQNFWMAENGTYGPDGISVTWSVAIEEQYYLVFPLLAILIPRRPLPVFLLLIASASAMWRAIVFMNDPSNNFPSDLGTLARLDGLAAGGLVACILQSDSMTKWLRGRIFILEYAVIGCLGACVFVRRDSGEQMAFFGHSMLTVCFALIVTYVVLNLGAESRWMRLLRCDTLRFLGKISYSLYLFHPIILATGLLITDYPKSLAGVPQVVLLATCLAASIFFSTLLFNYFESRFIAIGKKIYY